MSPAAIFLIAFVSWIAMNVTYVVLKKLSQDRKHRKPFSQWLDSNSNKE